MKYHEIPRNTKKYHEIPWNTMTYSWTTECHEIPWNTMNILRNTMKYHEIPWDTKKYQEIPWNTMKYHDIQLNHGMPWNTIGISRHFCAKSNVTFVVSFLVQKGGEWSWRLSIPILKKHQCFYTSWIPRVFKHFFNLSHFHDALHPFGKSIIQ